MAKTLKDKIAELSPNRQQKIKSDTALLIEEEKKCKI